MTQDRLSALQKHILIEALKNDGTLKKEDVYKDYFKIDFNKTPKTLHGFLDPKHADRKQKMAVILSRSLRRLKEKRLVTVRNHSYTSRLGTIRLTTEGRKRAVEIK